jgi:hypothetical protein
MLRPKKKLKKLRKQNARNETGWVKRPTNNLKVSHMLILTQSKSLLD